MNKLAVISFFTFAGLAAAQLPRAAGDPGDDGTPGGFFDSELLPQGSILENLTLPRYDKNLVLRTSIHARQVLLHDLENNLEGRTVQIDFFNKDAQPDGKLSLDLVRFDSSRDLVLSSRPFTLISEKLNLAGTGLAFRIRHQRGFIHGPVVAIALLDSKTRNSVMNSPTLPKPAAAAIAAIAATGLASASPRSQPAEQLLQSSRLTQEQLQALDAQTASTAPVLEAASQGFQEQLSRILDSARTASDAVASFLTEAGITLLATAATPGAEEPAAALPDVPPPPAQEGKERATIKADGGAYIDRTAGFLVLLKNVTLNSPEMNLSGASEVKVFFTPDPPEEGKPASDTPPAPDLKKTDVAEIGKISITRIVATGPAIVLERQPSRPGGDVIKGSGHMLVYDPENSLIILKGGSPWIMSGKNVLRSTTPGGYIQHNLATGVSTMPESLQIELDVEGRLDGKNNQKAGQNRRAPR